MKEGVRNLLVGVFVVAAFGALAVLMVWFGETPSWLRRSEWTLEITSVRELRGIGDGSPVNLNGVEIGRVEGLDFEDRSRPDRGVKIICRIKNHYSVPRGAVVKVYGATFGIGSGHVDILVEPGPEVIPLPREGAEIHGEMASMIGEVITKDMIGSIERTITNFGNLADAAEPVAKSLAKMLEQRSVAAVSRPDAAAEGDIANLTTVIERIDNLIAHVNTVLGDENVQKNVKGAVSDLKDATEELKETVTLWNTESQKLADNLNAGIDRTEENLDHTFGKLNETLENLDSAAKNLANVLHAVAEGKGTAGLLVRDARLYEAAVVSMERLSEVMENVLIITGKIREDGHITIGKAPSGVLKKDYPIPLQASEAGESR